MVNLGKVKVYSIILVKFTGGGHKWYKCKKGRNINHLVYNFSFKNALYLKIFEYEPRKKIVGKKYFWYSFNSQSFGFL